MLPSARGHSGRTYFLPDDLPVLESIPLCLPLIIVAWFPPTVNPYAPIYFPHVQSQGFLYHPWSRSALKPCSHWNMCADCLGCRSESNRHAPWRTVSANPHGRRCKSNILVIAQRLTSIGVNCHSVELDSCRAGGNENGRSTLWELVPPYMRWANSSIVYHSYGHTRSGSIYSPSFKFLIHLRSNQDRSSGHLQI